MRRGPYAIVGFLFFLGFVGFCEGVFADLDSSDARCVIEPKARCRAPIPNSILIRGATVVTSVSAVVGDVFISDGVIAAIRRRGEESVGLDGSGSVFGGDGGEVGCAERVIHADGMYLLPGGVDPHTHLDMPFMGTISADDFDSGHAAALAGGTTTHIDFVLPVNGSLEAGLAAWRGKAAGRARMDYGFHMVVDEWSERVEKEMERVVDEHGISSFKFFMAYKGGLMVTDEELIHGMKKAKALGALSMVHAENGDAVAEGQRSMIELGVYGPEGHALSRPAALEAEATARAAAFSQWLGAPLYVVHLMARTAAEAVQRAKAEGAPVIGEATLGGLFLDESQYWSTNFTWAAAHVMSPPIRSHLKDGSYLAAALANGDINVVGTDHCVFSSEQKRLGSDDFRLIPNGINGLEERLPLLWARLVRTGKLSLPRFAAVTATNAAKIFNLYPQKGDIKVGGDADLVILDDSATRIVSAATHHSRGDVNVFEGFEVPTVRMTVSRGAVVFEDGRVTAAPGRGRYLPRGPFAPEVFAAVPAADARRRAAMAAPVDRRATDE